MNDLRRYFNANTENMIRKWEHYFDIYDRHLSKFRNKEVHILEFGVLHGGSLRMWKEYFGPKATIYGVDINPQCKELEEEQIEIFIGDQKDKRFLESLASILPQVDILIDDGGHDMKQQINTYEVLFPIIDSQGVYICEDLQTSYFGSYGGGFRNKKSYIEYSKSFIDAIHAWHCKDQVGNSITDFTRSVDSLHYYNSVLVVEKRKVAEPRELKSGVAKVLPYSYPVKPWYRCVWDRFFCIFT